MCIRDSYRVHPISGEKNYHTGVDIGMPEGTETVSYTHLWQSLPPQTQQELKNTMNAMQPPQSVEEVKATLETTEKGGVRQSIRNCLTVFQRDPVLAGAIAYNILTDRKDIIKPIGFHRESTALTDTDMKYLLLYLEETYGLTSEKKIETAIGIVANENKYHPIRDFLNSLAWDGTERIRFCLRHFLGADVDDYTYEALKLFLLGAITRAFKPGSKFEIMLCLVGGQGAGKSTFFRLLAVRDEWFSDDLRKLDDDNVYRKLQGHWIIEMSEMMATANAKSIEEIKSFLSRQKEVYKIPYETHPADRPRQCVFGGTSNALDFLPLDRSGNRRFIPVMVYPEQAEVHILEDEAASRAYILSLIHICGSKAYALFLNFCCLLAGLRFLPVMVYPEQAEVHILEDEAASRAVSYTHLLGAIHRVFKPGCKFEVMLCLVGCLLYTSWLAADHGYDEVYCLYGNHVYRNLPFPGVYCGAHPQNR